MPWTAGNAVFVGVVVGALALCGCAPVEPTSVPTSSPVISKSFKPYISKEDAAKRLRDAYENYIRELNVVFRGGGADVELLRPLVTTAQYRREQSSVTEFQRAGSRISGRAKLQGFKLQSFDLPAGLATAYVCIDVSKTKILNDAGKDVTPDTREGNVDLVVKFMGDKLDGSETWTGASVC